MSLLAYREEPLDPGIRDRLLRLWREERAPLDEITELNVILGEAFAGALEHVVREEGIDSLDLVASHGQTIYHLASPGRPRATLQMGEAAVIAARIGVTVAADFRVADIAVGGEGAPLVPFFDALFFGHDRTRAVQNIGGIANVTFLAPDRQPLAFDTGPGNTLLNAAARTLFGEPYDRDGQHALAGRADESLLTSLLAYPYFRQTPPKSTGRETFGDAFAARVVDEGIARGNAREDIMATLTALTAESIACAYRDFGPPDIQEVILSGGGARNQALVAAIRYRLPGVPLRSHDKLGIPGNAKEAVAFALLGHETLVGRPGNLPPCTGASRTVVLGKIVPGDNYASLMRKVHGREAEWTPITSLRLVN